MELYTRISIPKTVCCFSYSEQMALLGTCFAENIGKKLKENKFAVDADSFGTLYNWASIAAAIRMLLHPKRFGGKDLFLYEDVYHSFAHHSCFSPPSEMECLDTINERLFSLTDHLRKAKQLIITFGITWGYQLKSTRQIVSNCHKLPKKMFEREMLSLQDIVEEYECATISLLTSKEEAI